MLLGVTIAEVSDPSAPFILQGRPYEESLKKAAEYGYEAVEIQLPDAEKLDRDRFFAKLKEHGIHLVSITTGLAVREGLTLSSPDAGIRRRAVERLCKMIDLAADCAQECASDNWTKAPDVMIGLIAGRQDSCPDRETFLSNLGESLKQIDTYAAQRKIRVILEPVNHVDNPGLNTFADAAKLLERYACGATELGVDLYHMSIEEEDIARTISCYADRIGSVQLMDQNRHVPGDGSFDFTPILQAIRKTGYDGAFIMECLPLPDPETALLRAAEFYHRYVAI